MSTKVPFCHLISHTPQLPLLIQHTSKELQIRRRRLRACPRHRKRIVRKSTHAQRHPDQIFPLRIKLGILLMPHIIVISQHTRHDTRRRKKVKTKRGAHIMTELLVIQRRSAQIRIRELIVLFPDEHHYANGVIVEGYADGLRACAHGYGVRHVPFVEGRAHPPRCAVHGRLFLCVHFVVLGRRAGTHIRVYRFAGGIPTRAQFADYPVAPVASLCGIRGVAQALHELVVHACGILQCPASGWALGPCESWERGHDDVEDGVLVVFGVDEGVHYVLELEECSWPAVHEEQWDGVLLAHARFFVNEVHF